MFLEATNEIGSRVTGAIREAARVTGAGFDYLLKTALRESNLDPNATAASSSATGLFQFVDQTWLSTLKESGPGLGYGDFADAIVKSPSGHYSVPDPMMRQQIMQLRTDPTANAVMAGAFTARNAAELNAALGRKPTDGELYIAHFLGAAGAVRLISNAVTTPQAVAADLFPDAARANPAIFYDKQGNARSVGQVYGVLVPRHDAASLTETTSAPPVQAATPSKAQPSFPVPAFPVAATPVDPPVAPTAAKVAAASPPVSVPAYNSLFRTDRGPISPVVTELWGPAEGSNTPAAPPVTPVSTQPSPSTTGRIGTTADFFQFLRSDKGGASSQSN